MSTQPSNQLSNLPPEIGQLGNLWRLNLSDNQLTSLPAELGQLSNLHMLFLSGNELSSIPAEIANLNTLCALLLENNQLRELPNELGQVSSLIDTTRGCIHYTGIHIENNPLISPPPEVAEQGTEAILAYLQNQPAYYVNRYF